MTKRAPRVDYQIDVAASNQQAKFHSLYSLNLSDSGLLIAANHFVPFEKEAKIDLVIDPWKEVISDTITCQTKVARLVQIDSKGIDKYREVLGESQEGLSIFGVYFIDISPEALKVWQDHINKITKVSSV